MITAQLDAAPRGEVEHVFSLPHTPGAVAGIRRRIRGILADWNLAADIAEDILLVVSELLTNAIVHALPPATLRLSRSRLDLYAAVRVEVTDMGPAAPPPRPASPLDPDEHGRGVGIVTALATRCGVHAHSDGTSRWAELRFTES
ncbi:ATP-binding protein [Streptomyces sp. ISL-22]|uniref:ATP-binding protein n=1 Tax=unclassified Streptomyces TaxID=2593676 RepID=UPI001BE838A4|nr:MULTISPECIES: ATP-binding protein [unclassified Streptomyces]MBT2416415.1 ATP-binding protein [Streptomyces sp. ISL-24]MBT2434214.1 ATP-binding protein [Streptomyces sp. ISL-22]